MPSCCYYTSKSNPLPLRNWKAIIILLSSFHLSCYWMLRYFFIQPAIRHVVNYWCNVAKKQVWISQDIEYSFLSLEIILSESLKQYLCIYQDDHIMSLPWFLVSQLLSNVFLCKMYLDYKDKMYLKLIIFIIWRKPYL